MPARGRREPLWTRLLTEDIRRQTAVRAANTRAKFARDRDGILDSRAFRRMHR